MSKIQGTIAGTGQSGEVELGKEFSLSLSGFGTASINLERSFDDGATWKVIETFTADTEKEGEASAFFKYRINTTAYTSGTIAFRLSD